MDIKINNFKKAYNKKTVLTLDDIEFKSNYIYCIIGSNGCGKTTFLEAVSGLNQNYLGTIFYDGTPYSRDIQRNISYMNQSPYLFDSSVKNNINAGLKFRKLQSDEITKKTKKYIDSFSLYNLLNENGKTLSEGEKAKVALIRSLVLDTNLLLLDEPTASMDLASTKISEDLIKNSKRENKTILMISHNIEQVKRISDYVIFLDSGKLLFFGKSSDFFSNENDLLLEKLLYI